ncbi:S-adenosylmethionine decarboxylase [candidate division WWE3 bacterium]|nr:S-adenosylmethionine decarboxylase [candidate division WWE3 bacterium]
MNQSTPIINHFIASFNVIDFKDSLIVLDDLGTSLCKLLNLKIVQRSHHEYGPIGKTLVFIISTSHLAIHTWPEYKYIHLDLLTCSKLELSQFEQALKASLIEIQIENLKFRQIESLNQ